MPNLYLVALFILIVGGLNWLSIGLGQGDLVYQTFGEKSNYVYDIVGIAAVIVLAHQIMGMSQGVKMMV